MRRVFACGWPSWIRKNQIILSMLTFKTFFRGSRNFFSKSFIFFSRKLKKNDENSVSIEKRSRTDCWFVVIMNSCSVINFSFKNQLFSIFSLIYDSEVFHLVFSSFCQWIFWNWATYFFSKSFSGLIPRIFDVYDFKFNRAFWPRS